MDFSVTLIDLAGTVALLLWGVHMVQTGIQRAFGPSCALLLGRALRNRVQGVPRRASASPRSCRAAPRPA